MDGGRRTAGREVGLLFVECGGDRNENEGEEKARETGWKREKRKEDDGGGTTGKKRRS